MAIVWGAWEYSGGNGMRVGVEATSTGVGHTSTTTTYTFKIYTQNQYAYADPQTLTYGGSAGSGSTSFTNNSGSSSSGGGAVLRATKTYTYTYPAGSYGSSPATISFTATLSGAYNGVTPSVSRSFSIAPRPYGVPAAPTGTTATRNSDSQATVTWTRHATTGEPYSSQTVQMRTYSYPNSWSAWANVATVSGTATSYVKTGLSANHAYQFRVRANNSVGSSAFDTSSNIYTTPAAPTSVDSSINSSGTQITTTWVNNAYLYANNTFQIERSVNGGAYASVATGLTYGTTSWTDTAPGAGSNRYRIRIYNSVQGIYSAYAYGDTVTTVVPPLAPTSLSPNGAPVDFNNGVELTWKHNPGTDKAAQSHFTIETSSNGGSTWTTLANNIASSTSSYVIPAATFTNGTTYLWRVRTQGATTAAYGPNSANASLIGTSEPVPTITAPGDPLVVLPFTVEWTYSQDEGSPQAGWAAELFNEDGTVLLQHLEGDDAATGATFTHPVEDGVTYQIGVRVKSAAGLWSYNTLAVTTVDLLPPAAADLVAVYQPSTGSTVLSISPQTSVPGTNLPVDTVTVDRRIEGGEWVTLFTGLFVPNDVIDPLPPTKGLVEYQVTSVSTSPSYLINPVTQIVVSDPVAAGPNSQWVFVNYGDAFDKLLRFRGNPKVGSSAGRRKSVQPFLGRRKPILLLGQNRSRELSVDGDLVYDPTGVYDDQVYLFDSPPEDWETAGLEAEVVCLRDYTGRRIFGSISDVSSSNQFPGMGGVSFTVTEVDYDETYGLFEDVEIYTNLLLDENSSFEGGTVGDWGTSYFGAPAAVTITSDATRAIDGTRSMKIVYPNAAGGAGPQLPLGDLDPAGEYVARCRVYVPAGSPAVRFGDPFGNTGNSDSTVKDAWQTLTITWTGKTSVYLSVRSLSATTGTEAVWADTFSVYRRS